MKGEIKNIFANINDWLKFAEAKHTGMLILNSGVIFGLFTVLKDYQYYLPKTAILLSLICFGLSMLFSIVSLYPSSHNIQPRRKKITNPNLYFNQHISMLNVEDFKSELIKIDTNYKFDKLDDDLIYQIIINSTIATRKYKLFKFSTIFTTMGLGIPLITTLLKIICHL